VTPADRTPLERLIDALQVLLPAVQRMVESAQAQRSDGTLALMAARQAAAITDELKPKGGPR
jgi:hypothetical protein